MPLSCQSPEGPLFAYSHDADLWAKLAAENKRNEHLFMPCCDSKVVLKKSTLGTQFFAHKRVGACTSAPESTEHLFAKDAIARAAISVGWDAVTESRSDALKPEWIADVLCSDRTERHKKIAFEVQWTRQTFEETQRRELVYQSAGIPGIWLMRQRDVPVSRDIPAFHLEFLRDKNALEVWLPGPGYRAAIELRMRSIELDWAQRIPLHKFVMGALSGSLRFDPLVGMEVPIRAELSTVTCFKCQRSIRILKNLTVQGDNVCPGIGEFTFSLSELEEGLPTFQAWIARELPASRLKQYCVGELKLRFSRMAQQQYLSNGCIYCGALQGRFFEHEAVDSAPIEIGAWIEISTTLLSACQEAWAVRRWWFDESVGN